MNAFEVAVFDPIFAIPVIVVMFIMGCCIAASFFPGGLDEEIQVDEQRHPS